MELWSGIISFILFTFTFVSFLVQVVGHEFSKFVSGFFQQGSAWTFVKVNEMSRVSRWEGSLKKEREAGCENLNSLFSSHFLPFPLPSFSLAASARWQAGSVSPQTTPRSSHALSWRHCPRPSRMHISWVTPRSSSERWLTARVWNFFFYAMLRRESEFSI